MKIITKLLTISFFAFTFMGIEAQEQRHFTIHTIAFYNLENAFDIEDDPLKFDESSPMMEIVNNRDSVYQNKIKNMAKVIADIGFETTQNTPAIIGVCEVENRNVLEDIINQPTLLPHQYGIIHFDSPDARGIDVALLYQKSIFKPKSSKTYPLVLFDDETGKRIYTRDLLVVSGFLDGDLIQLMINHWPSRRGGETISNPKRERAAKLNKHIIDSLQTENPYAKIVIMGDLNDNPTDSSLKHILKTEKTKDAVVLKGIYNPFETFYKHGTGTTAYRDRWSLFDQILVSQPLLENDFSSYQYYKAGIFNPNYLVTATGTYKGYPFRSFGYEGFTGGYSDHFPVYVYLIRER